MSFIDDWNERAHKGWTLHTPEGGRAFLFKSFSVIDLSRAHLCAGVVVTAIAAHELDEQAQLLIDKDSLTITFHGAEEKSVPDSFYVAAAAINKAIANMVVKPPEPKAIDI